MWRGWATPGGSANRPVKSTRLASEAQVKSRLFPKTRSWFALGAPLELLSPLSVLRILYALLLVAWPVTAGMVGTTGTHGFVAVSTVELVTGTVWVVLLRIRNIGVRWCRVLMALVAFEAVVLVASGIGTLASFGYMLMLVPIAVAPALFLSLRAVLVQQFVVGGVLWVATAPRWGLGRSAVVVAFEVVGALSVSLTIILLTRTVQRRGGVDTDTGLPNGFGLADRVAGRGTTEALVVASVFLKGIGDAREALGYHVGTELLRRAVENLGQVLPAAADIGRVDGDELVVINRLGTAGPNRAEADAQAQVLAETLREAITAGRYLVDDIEVSLRANVGLAVAPWDGDDVPELIRRATLSARKAAAQGRGHVTWSGDEGALTASDLALLAQLRLASERGELSLAYQPQVEVRSMRIVSAEALLRWGSVTLGSVPPGMFVPLAERTGLIDRLTDWVMGEALDAQVRWRRAGLHIPVSVNLSATSLTVPDLAQWILSELDVRHLPPSSLTVEVTETAAIDLLQAVDLLRPLHDRGVRVSIDDFGTGYTSLSALPDLPLDELKVDQRFVLRSSSSAADETIVRTVRELAHRLGLVAVAEGVENLELFERMVALDFDVLQGYHLAKPLTEDDLVAAVMDQEIGLHRDQATRRSPVPPASVGGHGPSLLPTRPMNYM